MNWWCVQHDEQHRNSGYVNSETNYRRPVDPARGRDLDNYGLSRLPAGWHNFMNRRWWLDF